jgi:hypothetical protein
MKSFSEYCALGLTVALMGAPLSAYAASGNDAQANGSAGISVSGAGGSQSSSGAGNEGTGGAGTRTGAMTNCAAGASGQMATRSDCPGNH